MFALFILAFYLFFSNALYPDHSFLFLYFPHLSLTPLPQMHSISHQKGEDLSVILTKHSLYNLMHKLPYQGLTR